jgi:tetratricopeptide (TPR) repeat protein
MKHVYLPATALAFLANCAGGAAPTAAQMQKLHEAQALLADDKPDDALRITDELLHDQPEWRDARLCSAKGFVALSKIDRKNLPKELVLQDAATAYERALAIDDKDADSWVALAQVRYELGLYESARTAAEQAMKLFEEQKKKPAAMTAAVLIGARCDLQELRAARAAELEKGDKDRHGVVQPKPETMQLGTAALQKLQPILSLEPAEAFGMASEIYRLLGHTEEALAMLERGIRTAPEANDLHLAFQNLYVAFDQRRALVGAYGRLVRERPTVPILLWYRGRAQVLLADQLRHKGDFANAIAAYQHAADSYGEYRAMVPAHAASAAQWLAICELSMARVACDAGELDDAQKHLIAAEQDSPLATTYEQGDPQKPALLDSFNSHYCAVVGAIGRALSSGADPLPKTLAFYQGIVERQPGKWAFAYNNAALPARDLGVQLVRDVETKSPEERQAAMTRAMELWERSYRWYEQAVALSPDDPRIVNDCGLMLIYHLNRDFDRARALFDQAIKSGQAQLDALPKDAPDEQRNFLEEAVGDAWQNIAVLMVRHQHRPFAEVKPFLEHAVALYPRQEREAAYMLAHEGREPEHAAPGGQGGQGNAAVEKARADAEQKAKDGDLDGALTVLDQAVRDHKELKTSAAFQLLRGDYTLRYARAAAAGRRKGTDLLFEDAVGTLKKAVELDGASALPRQLLAEAYCDKGDAELAARTASDLLQHLQSQGGGAAAADLDAAHAVRARAAAAVVQEQGDKADKALLADARASFRWLDQKQKLDAAQYKAWSAMESRAGAVAEAVGVFARQLAKKPDDQALLGAVVDTAAAAGQSAAAVDALKARDDAVGVWFLGRARYSAAADLRTAGKNDDALAELGRARECFEKSMAKNKDFAVSCRQWIAMCLGKMGNIALANGRDFDAEKWLLESVRLQPDRIGEDLGLQETTKRGVMLVADKYVRAQDLAHAESIFRASAAAANGDLDLLNNAGLFARDHGVELARTGRDKDSKAMFEQSYQCYQRAHQLTPTDVRIANDTALIAIHYLDRDWDQSRQTLEAAIKEGDKQMPAIPADKPQERRNLDEAIGDCWENLALWHLKHSNDAAAAKQAAQHSLEHAPPERGGARRLLEQADKLLQGK